MAKKIRGRNNPPPPLRAKVEYSDCLQCADCLEVTPYNRITCRTAIPPVENCKDRKIKCVRFKTKTK